MRRIILLSVTILIFTVFSGCKSKKESPQKKRDLTQQQQEIKKLKFKNNRSLPMQFKDKTNKILNDAEKRRQDRLNRIKSGN